MAVFIFGRHLASHGFVTHGIHGLNSYLPLDENLIEYPQYLLFGLEMMASQPTEPFRGLIDVEHVGAMGYFFDGYNELVLGGTRVDPEY